MEFICNTQLLTSAILNVGLAVSPKSSLLALEGILICAKGEVITLTGYNLELGINTQIYADIVKEGSIVIPAKLFTDIVRKVDSDDIEISVNDKDMVQINAGNSSFNIPGMAALEFPELATVSDENQIKMSQSLFKSLVNQVTFAASTSAENSPMFAGICFDLQKEDITVVALDGFKLGLRREKCNFENESKLIVPVKTIQELLKLIKDEKDDSEKDMIIDFSQKHVIFRIDDYNVVSRLIEGEYIDYNSAIPVSSTSTVVVNTKSLINSIERAALLIHEKAKTPLRMEFKDDGIHLSCSSSSGKANDHCEATLDGDSILMGINHRFFIDALKNTECDVVKLELNNSTTALKIMPMEGDNFTFLVVPMILKG